MSNKYFGTDGIRGTVNQGNITGEKFFKMLKKIAQKLIKICHQL